MAPSLTRFLIPAVTFYAMVVVGLGLTRQDFRRVRERPRAVAVAALGPVLLLPILAGLLARALRLPVPVAGALLTVAACPAGVLSNFYSELARANVALSVTLTAVSSLLSVFTLPAAAAAAFAVVLGNTVEFRLPIGAATLELLLLLLVPVVLGMVLRAHAPWVERRRGRLQAFAVVALVGLIALIAWEQAELLARFAGALVLAASSFLPLALACGALLGRWASPLRSDRITVAFQYANRNLGVAVLVGARVLGRDEVLALAVVSVLTHTILMLLTVAWLRRASSPRVDSAGA